MMELEHIVGYNGQYLDTLHASPDPSKPSTYYMPVGANVIIGNLDDPHDQQLLRGHDETISAMVVSNRGTLLASGQVGSTKSKGNEAPVLVWDLENGGQELYQLLGHTHGILRLAFSPDERYLIATGLDSLMYIWDMQTGEVVTGQKSPQPITLVAWGAVHGAGGRRPTYQISTAYSTQVMVNNFGYDPRSMQYQLDAQPCTMPTTGMVREYNGARMTHNGEFLVAGCSSGEFAVFNTAVRVFRASVPVGSNGVLCLALDPEGNLYLGCGDGMIKKMAGRDDRWELLAEVKVSGRVASLSVSSDGTELLVGTSMGRVYKALCEDLSVMEIASSHIDGINDVAFGTHSDTFATISRDGSWRVWDSNDYTIVAQNASTEPGICISYAGGQSVTTGWGGEKSGSCSIRNYDASSGALVWEIPGAHQGPVTAITTILDKGSVVGYVSGGEDGHVRVWQVDFCQNGGYRKQMICDFAEHKGTVTQVLVDVAEPYLIHSCGVDRQIFTYNISLKPARRTNSHLYREGAFRGMSQRLDSELELITVSSHGDVFFWDCDEKDPVGMLDEFGELTGVQVSPSGAYVAVCGKDCSVKVWDIRTQQLVAVGVGHSQPVTKVHWSPDQKQLVSVDLGCCICVWNFYGADDEQ